MCRNQSNQSLHAKHSHVSKVQNLSSSNSLARCDFIVWQVSNLSNKLHWSIPCEKHLDIKKPEFTQIIMFLPKFYPQTKRPANPWPCLPFGQVLESLYWGTRLFLIQQGNISFQNDFPTKTVRLGVLSWGREKDKKSWHLSRKLTTNGIVLRFWG